MAIGDDFTINYTDLKITHTSGTAVYEMYQLYSWIMDEIDESTTIDDTVPMTAQTPTAFTLVNGWFIDETSIQYLKGGSLKTDGWASGGIRIISYNASTTPFSASDLGQTITGGTTGDTGTVLAYEERYGTNLGVVWIRPDDSGDAFDDPTETFLVTGPFAAGVFTNTFYSGGSLSGENIWTNIFTLGTLEANTTLYVYQNDSLITGWWSAGQIDVLILTKEGGVEIDGAVLTILARQYTKLFDHFVTDLSAGSRTPIPLATFDDSNNSTGYREMVFTTASAGYTVGEVINGGSSGAQGIVTSSTGTLPNITIEYYLIGTVSIDFHSSGAETVTGVSSGSTATSVAPTNVEPADFTGITFTFGATSQDLGNGAGSQPYDVIIDLGTNSYTLAQAYEYFKYVTRRGSATSLNGHNGEDYIAVGDVYLPYDAQSANFTEGATLTGTDSGATGIIVSDHDAGTSGALVLRDVTGTFDDNETITDDNGSPGSATSDTSAGYDLIAPAKQSPFGTFAGGKFFGARGVYITNVLAADANNYQLIDSTGTTQVPPITIPLTVNNTVSGDRVSMFLTSGGNIDRAQFTSHNTNNTAGGNTFEVLESIPNDTPSSGTIRVIDNSLNREQRYTFTSWTGSVFSGISPVLITTYENTDTAYVPYLDEQATGTSVSTTISYVTNREVITRVRIVGMLPFSVPGTINSSGITVTTIRSTDSIYQ